MLIRKIHLPTAVFLWIFSLPCGFSQTSAAKHLGVENGLSNNYIVDIEQDGKGCIWIATESGLNRFDGHSFTVYRTNNSALVGNELNTLLYSKDDDKLWIGSQRNGISVLDCATQTFDSYTNDNELITNDVTHLSFAADGGIWITHYHLGIEHFDRQTGQFTQFRDSEIANMRSLKWCSCDDGSGNLYVGHAQDGLSIIDLKNKTARNFRNEPDNPKSLPGNDVRAVYIDRKKNIWTGSNKGLALFNPQTEEFVCFAHDADNPNSLIADYIYDIGETRDGNLWIATDAGGISILDINSITLADPKTVKFRNIASTGDGLELSSSNIRSLFQDSFGNMWIGNYGDGLDIISHSQPVFQTVAYTKVKKDKHSNKPVWGICADSEGRVWMGSENEIAVFENGRLKRQINLSSHLSNPITRVCAIEQDRHGVLWLGLTNEDILKYNPSTDKFERIKSDVNTSGFIVFFEDADGKMWTGTVNGVYSFEHNEIRREDAINEQLTDIMIYGILRDRQGKLWTGTFGKGISIFDSCDRLVTRLEIDSGFCSNAINHLYMDSRGGIWAATRNGLAHFDDTENPAKYRLYNNEHGLVDTYIRAICEDADGNIWVSSNASVSMLDREKQRFDNYDYRDGIPIGNFVEGSACMTPDGAVYFGSISGVCRFRPTEFTSQRQVAPVQIIECRSFDEQIESREENLPIPAGDGRIELPFNRNSFRISFSSPDFAHREQVEYAYTVEGLTGKWHSTHGENQVTFRNLASGDYRFRVKARLRNQEWDETHVASLSVNIRPPFWLAWYAKTLYAVLACAAIFFVVRFYKRRLNLESSLEIERKESRNRQELNDERLRFYTNIAHELRTPLTLIIGPLEDLLNDGNLSDYHNRKIAIIHGSAKRLHNAINQILEFRKTETQNQKLTVSRGNPADLVIEIGLYYKEMNRNNRVTYHIDVEAKDVSLYFDPNMLATILHNLLSNAVKYTPEGEIRLCLRQVEEKGTHYIEIEVSDTGYGIEPKALPHIFERYYQAKGSHQASGTGIGLALVKSLTDLHEGSIHVESTMGKGTVFTFRILKDNTYPNALHKESQRTVKCPEPNNLGREAEENDVRPVVLIVEDNADIREYITSSFAADYNIIVAADGKEGLELAQKHIPNIIVSDIMMPVMDGIELCKSIKENIHTSHIPVILLTAKDAIQDKEEGYLSGADSYLTKPFSTQLLHTRINNLLESRRKLARQIVANMREIRPDTKTHPIKMSALDAEFLAKITELVESNLNTERLDISFIAEKMKMSHSTFYRKIKGLTGIPANEFIRKIRLKHSLQLLTDGAYNISEIAFMTGFNDIDYFRECFKKEYGMTPSEYAKQQVP